MSVKTFKENVLNAKISSMNASTESGGCVLCQERNITVVIGADVNGNPFTPITVSATDTGNSIIILGSGTTNSIVLQFPADVEAGTYNLPSSGFQATYTESGSSSAASSGSVTVEVHDPASGTLSGTFSFQAGSATVTSGYFDVTY